MGERGMQRERERMSWLTVLNLNRIDRLNRLAEFSVSLRPPKHMVSQTILLFESVSNMQDLGHT